jgi:hypothetical protein
MILGIHRCAAGVFTHCHDAEYALQLLGRSHQSRGLCSYHQWHRWSASSRWLNEEGEDNPNREPWSKAEHSQN